MPTDLKLSIWTLGAKVSDLDREIGFVRSMGGDLVLDDLIVVAGRPHRVPLLRFGDKYLHILTEMVYEPALESALPFGLAHVVFEVGDLDEARARALAGGASEVIPPAQVEAGFGNRRVAFLRSPGGILFELAQIQRHGVPRPGGW